jgi:hypothetical protein
VLLGHLCWAQDVVTLIDLDQWFCPGREWQWIERWSSTETVIDPKGNEVTTTPPEEIEPASWRLLGREPFAGEEAYHLLEADDTVTHTYLAVRDGVLRHLGEHEAKFGCQSRDIVPPAAQAGEWDPVEILPLTLDASPSECMTPFGHGTIAGTFECLDGLAGTGREVIDTFLGFLGRERITVRAGTFDCFVVCARDEWRDTGETSLGVMVETTGEFERHLWIHPTVGIVKEEFLLDHERTTNSLGYIWESWETGTIELASTRCSPCRGDGRLLGRLEFPVRGLDDPEGLIADVEAESGEWLAVWWKQDRGRVELRYYPPQTPGLPADPRDVDEGFLVGWCQWSCGRNSIEYYGVPGDGESPACFTKTIFVSEDYGEDDHLCDGFFDRREYTAFIPEHRVAVACKHFPYKDECYTDLPKACLEGQNCGRGIPPRVASCDPCQIPGCGGRCDPQTSGCSTCTPIEICDLPFVDEPGPGAGPPPRDPCEVCQEFVGGFDCSTKVAKGGGAGIAGVTVIELLMGEESQSFADAEGEYLASLRGGTPALVEMSPFLPCDLDRDSDCDEEDANAFAAALGSCAADAGYRLLLDIDLDGCITPADREYFFGLESVATLFRRGDCNDDGAVDISDGVCILNWLFLGGATPGCVAVTNTNGDAGSDISDAVYVLTHLFLGGPAPVEPFPGCGPGTLPADEVTCETPPKSCQQ